MHNDHIINLLLIDDDEDDYLITKEILSDIEGQSYNLEWVDTYDVGLETMLQQKHDIYLVDYQIGEKTGLDLLNNAKNLGIKRPIIMLTGLGDREIDSKAIQAGAADYLIKGQITEALLERSIRHAIERHKTLIALQESEERYTIAAEGANDGLWDWNIKENKVYYSPRWKVMLGYNELDIKDSLDEWLERLHPDDLERVKEVLGHHLKGLSMNFESEYRIRQKDGRYRWVLNRGLAIRNILGNAYRMAGWQTDLSGRVAAYDSLTNLPNRTLFLDRLKRALDYSTYQKTYRFAVLYIDLDHFKAINDSLGHASGDDFLIEVAKRLEQSMRSSKPKSSAQNSSDNNQERLYRDTLARFGGDEFAILLEGIKSPQDAVKIAERIQTLLANPFKLKKEEVRSSASIGIALSDTGYQTPDNILRDADIAMYRAKQEGKARYTLFDSSMYAEIKSRLSLEMSLKQALEKKQFKVFYQPIINLETEQIVSCEALVRWHHPEKGLLAPTSFLELAEETGLILELDRWVIAQACQFLGSWNGFSKDLKISINLSSKYLRSYNLANNIKTILAENESDTSRLTLEVTEVAISQSPKRICNTLETLRSWGMLIQLDNFGTGYSSLNRLLSFPIDTLKIDRSFISEIDKNNNKAGIVQAILMLTQTLGIKVVAEGVENISQSKLLHSLGCSYAQGYLFGKPLEPEALIKQLKSGNA